MTEALSSPNELPRLLLLSDVNAERAAAGALLLYRLLGNYPPDRLQVISYPTQGWKYDIERLEGVQYHDFPYRVPRYIFNRFNPFWPLVMAQFIKLRTREALRYAQAFRPEVVVSVAHDYLWFVADAVARKLRIPLHLILYDDWPYLHSGAAAPWVRPYVTRACDWMIRRVFRRAACLHAVSPGMAELYEAKGGARCQVLYPSRGEDSPKPAVRVRNEPIDRPVMAYAGMIHQDWVAAALRAAAGELAAINGRLDLYVPYPNDRLAAWGLAGPHIRTVGFFPAHEMAERVAASAQVLFMPASFDPSDWRKSSTLFPSKFADYTAIGLPILVWGPEYTSAARWAAENAGATVLVTDPKPEALRGPLARLVADPAYAAQVAAAGVEAGKRYFDLSRVRETFFAALQTET
jgi:hypothetical protein